MNKSTLTYMLPLALFASSAYADSSKTIAVENELNTVVKELISTATLNNHLLTEQSNDIQKV